MPNHYNEIGWKSRDVYYSSRDIRCKDTVRQDVVVLGWNLEGEFSEVPLKEQRSCRAFMRGLPEIASRARICFKH